MTLRTALFGILATVGLVPGAAMAFSYDWIDLRLHPDRPEIPTIEVDGKPDGNYTKIATKTLEYGVYVRGDRPTRMVPGTLSLRLEIGDEDPTLGTTTEEWTRHVVTIPYEDPRHGSPVALCNERLRKALEAGQRGVLSTGQTFLYEEAYIVSGLVSWELDYYPDHTQTEAEFLKVPAKIKCLGLNRDRAQDGGPSRTSPPVPPLFWATTFRIEEAKSVRDGRYMCPTELKLYGFVETGRKFQGKAIFMGPHYLSALTPLNFSYAGSRNLTATYPVKWKEIGGLTTTSDPKPKKQKLTFHFNISNLDGKLIKSVKKVVDVSCAKIEAEAPVGMTGSPSTDPLEP